MNTIMDILAAVADPLRLRSLALMEAEGEVCVCELVAALDAPQPKVSRHLAVLRSAGVVADRRDAQWVFYRIDPALTPEHARVVASAVAAARTTPEHGDDRARLAAFTGRPRRAGVA